MTTQELYSKLKNIKYLYRNEKHRDFFFIQKHGFIPKKSVEINYFIQNIIPIFNPFIAINNPDAFSQYYTCFSTDQDIYQIPNYKMAVDFSNIEWLKNEKGMQLGGKFNIFTWILFKDKNSNKTYIAITKLNTFYEINCLDVVKEGLQYSKDGGKTWEIVNFS